MAQDNNPSSDQQADSQKDHQNDKGEGNYAASRKFDADEKAFVEKNRDAIPGLAKKAAEALDGPEGDELREAEAASRASSMEEDE